MWSSWPWVSTSPTTCLRRSRTYVKSGRTRSTPSISSVGNMSPVSTIRIFSSCSKRVMLRPISPTPPSQMTRVRPVAGFPPPPPGPPAPPPPEPRPPPLPAPFPAARRVGGLAVSTAISSHQPCRPQRLTDPGHLVGGGFGQREARGSGRVPGQLHGRFHRDRVGGDVHDVVDADQLGIQPAGPL